jgi:hypothetical protein
LQDVQLVAAEGVTAVNILGKQGVGGGGHEGRVWLKLGCGASAGRGVYSWVEAAFRLRGMVDKAEGKGGRWAEES